MTVLSVRYTAAGAGERLARSLRETGFAVLTDHPIPRETIAGVYAEWERFFASDGRHAYAFRSSIRAPSWLAAPRMSGRP